MKFFSRHSRERRFWALPDREVRHLARDKHPYWDSYGELCFLDEGWYWRALFLGLFPILDWRGPYRTREYAVWAAKVARKEKGDE